MFFKNKKAVVNVIKLAGVIAADGSKNLNLDRVKPQIDKAFIKNKSTKAVAFVINSPGGSPVQSETIANYVLYKSKQNNIPVITFIEDVAASGGYWLAVMGSTICALSSCSIVGSIGVVSAGFGLEEFIKKQGITRRVYTAGTNKVTRDMFLPENPEHTAKFNNLLQQVHSHFKKWILQQRAGKLNALEDQLFNGDFWIASEGLKLGLIDKIVTSTEEELKAMYGQKVQINYISGKKPSLISRLLGVNFANLSYNLANESLNVVKQQNQYSKYGL